PLLFLPPLLSFIFFALFPPSPIYLQHNKIPNIPKQPTQTPTFPTLQHYPLPFILTILTLIVIIIFFLTSPHSPTYV
ncbi:BCCT family transporter, partial [Staphylococcus warneri]|uniref:BCCT family transporter n=1 Tax=Staphylococcus warneri TaxID=1292 RepID=UPI00164274A4